MSPRFRTVVGHGIKSCRFPLSSLNTWQRFCTVMWHGSKNYRFLVFKPKSMRWGFLTVVWHGSKFPFSSLNIWDRGFSQACSWKQNCRFPFSSLNIWVSDSCGVEAKVTGFCFQSRYIGVSPWVAWKQKLQVPVWSLNTWDFHSNVAWKQKLRFPVWCLNTWDGGFHRHVAWNKKLQVPCLKPKYMRWGFPWWNK